MANTSETGAGGAADAVGDACDPNPTAGGDSIFYFDGFTSSLATNGWVSSTSLPNVNGGIIEQNSLGDLDLIWRPGASLENVTVDVRGYFGQINQATPPNEMGAIVRGSTSANDGVACLTVRTSATTATQGLFDVAGGVAADLSVQGLSPVPANGSEYAYVLTARGTAMTCTVTPLSGAPVVRSATSARPAGSVGVYMYNARHRVRSITVIAHGGS